MTSSRLWCHNLSKLIVSNFIYFFLLLVPFTCVFHDKNGDAHMTDTGWHKNHNNVENVSWLIGFNTNEVMFVCKSSLIECNNLITTLKGCRSFWFWSELLMTTHITQGRSKPFQRPRQDLFSAPPHRLWRHLLNQPWHDLFKRKQTHSRRTLYILNLLMHLRQGPFHQHPSTQKLFQGRFSYIILIDSMHVGFTWTK